MTEAKYAAPPQYRREKSRCGNTPEACSVAGKQAEGSRKENKETHKDKRDNNPKKPRVGFAGNGKVRAEILREKCFILKD